MWLMLEKISSAWVNESLDQSSNILQWLVTMQMLKHRSISIKLLQVMGIAAWLIVNIFSFEIHTEIIGYNFQHHVNCVEKEKIWYLALGSWLQPGFVLPRMSRTSRSVQCHIWHSSLRLLGVRVFIIVIILLISHCCYFHYQVWIGNSTKSFITMILFVI